MSDQDPALNPEYQAMMAEQTKKADAYVAQRYPGFRALTEQEEERLGQLRNSFDVDSTPPSTIDISPADQEILKLHKQRKTILEDYSRIRHNELAGETTVNEVGTGEAIERLMDRAGIKYEKITS